MSNNTEKHVIRKTFYITKENEDNLQKIAKKGYQTEVVNIALQKYLAEQLAENARNELIQGFFSIKQVDIGISSLDAIQGDRKLRSETITQK
jgi:hypothetical protein